MVFTVEAGELIKIRYNYQNALWSSRSKPDQLQRDREMNFIQKVLTAWSVDLENCPYQTCLYAITNVWESHKYK